jgi:hypothetical protein
MPPKAVLALFLAALLAGGCSSPPPPPGVLERGPHRGILRPLPSNYGYVEIVTQVDATKSSKNPKSRLIVYFLENDRTSPLKTAPSEVSMDVIWPDSTPRQTITLDPKPTSVDPVNFMSEPGNYDVALSGTLTAKFGDQTIQAAF